ncbi:UNVERIFIED_CONTAM: hypothetical protein FKN15_016467 [Acipenser sinensis]
MNTAADDKKPPLAPKPKILDQLTSKLPSSLMSRPSSASRGPKPPIAPKPKLLQDSEEKCCLYTNNNLNRCTNGKLLCSEEEFNEENTCSTYSESESFQIMDGGYIMLPDNETLTNERDDIDNEEGQLLELSSDAEVLNSTDNIDGNGEVELEEAVEPDQTEDTVSLETDETGDAVSTNTVEACTELVESVEALSNDGTSDSENREEAEAVDSGAGPQGKDTGRESDQDLGEVAEDVGASEGDEENQKDQILDDDTSCGISEENNPSQSPPVSEGSDDLNEQSDPEKEDQENVEVNEEREDQVVELCENMVPEEQETQDYLVFSSNDEQLQLAKQIDPCSLILDPNLLDETVTVEPDFSLSVGDDAATIDMGNETNMLEEFTENETNGIMNLEDQVAIEKSENVESSNFPCDVFEEEQSFPTLEDDIVEDDFTLEETHAFIDREKTSNECEGLDQELVCEKKDDEIFPNDTEENVYSLAGTDDLPDENAKAEDCSTVENINNVNTLEDEALSKLEELVVEPEETETVCTDVNDYTICNQDHCGLQAELCTVTLPKDVDSLFNRPALLDDSELFGDDNEGLIVPYMEDIEQEKSEDTISEEHVYEEAGLDTDGENLNFIAVDRKTIVTRTRSYSGKVPGYVPETVPEESDLQNTNEYCTVALDKSDQHLGESEQLDINRAMLSKSRHFILYPRSYSVEGRDMPMSVYRENDGVENCGMKRNDDNLSLPCVIGSSGSFSQRSYLSSSGMSTPSSVVDIPPPFELACITKKPVTKSSPSLLMENESPDKPKKKKLSFKRFLTLRFKKKTENKVHVDVNVSSSRSSSESSHQGPLRLLELDRRSLGSSPQLKSRSGKSRASDSPSTFLFYKDGKRKGTHKTFSRSVSRVESFEDRSRPPFMALPLTKPRSISFPNADTSDYENIPAMNSDYENIQIPPRRPSRTGTFTEFFEDPCRALSSANENDGYVDMSSFNAFESNPQTPDQETERPALLDDSELFGDDNEGLIVPYMEDIEQEKSEDTISEEHVYEEAGLDTDGENLNFIAVDRKTIVTRTRSYSGKVPGYVPETVPEESDLQNTNEYCTVALDKSDQHLGESEQLDINRAMLSKSRHFILYPRSYSVEGRDMPMSVYRENDGVENCGMKRNDDNLSLPCVIGSSGSFSQRSYLSSSGMSTPSSVVDIPPPFELACITKKPVTKSSPSLLMENESPDKPKKKKLSFKRFLTLRFKKKTENKVHVDVNVSSSRSSSESSHQGPLRLLELDRRSLGSSPQLKSRSGKSRASDSPSTFLFYKDGKRKGTHKTFSRSVSRVESFEDRSRPPFMALPLTKPRSISFPNADTSDYENIPAMNSDYENIQIPPRRPSRTGTFTEFFEDPCRALSSANENDGYVDMSSFNAFESNPQTPDQETERTCGLEDFREAIQKVNCEQSKPVVEEERLTAILCELPQVYELHQDILKELEERINDWEAHSRIADVILSRRPQFNVFNTYLTEFDRNIALLDECCQKSQIFASAVQQFEQSPGCANVSVKHQLLKVILRILQYRMLLTDYLNNLSPDSSEYEDTQAALVIVSEVADRANDSMRQGVFVKEGTLMKVSRKNRHPRHLFLMNDVLLYTYPQQDGKYRLKNTLSLSDMKISKPIIDKVQNALKIEGADYSIILSASSCSEREDWYHVLSRAVADHSRGRASPSSSEAREKLWMCLGEKPPTLVPVSHVMMCMNCASDFSLTLRRHHCHACGKIVCRSCSRNKCPLKYLKDRLAKVCDQCYTELKKRGVECPTPGDNLLSRSSGRPLSAVFQSIHPTALWKQRKNPSALTKVAASAEGSSMNGPLRRCKRNKRHWKNLWFVIKDKVLYTYTTSEDKVATESLPLLGFTVKLPGKVEGGMEPALVFQLYHKKTLYYTFQSEDAYTAQR